MTRRRILAASALVAAMLVGLHISLVLTASPMMPLRIEPLLEGMAYTPTDGHYDLALRYAPWILHETDSRRGRADIPSALDLDGDRDGTNAWENMPRYALLPTIYYMVLQSETHWFVTYHIYHPRAWSSFDLGIGTTHEGDGANVQVVVDKATTEIVLLTTQTTGSASSYASALSPVKSGRATLRADFEVVTGHPSIYVERGTHDVFGSRDPRAANRLARIGEPVVAYRPADSGENVTEPKAPWTETAAYRLVSLPAFLGNTTDHPTLFTGGDDGRAPRYQKGDRYSGPAGASRGASPFAMGLDREEGPDDLFWSPAESYAKAFSIQGNWSLVQARHPFAKGDAK